MLAAGDIARCKVGKEVGAEATARLLDGQEGTILALGDLAYRDGTLERFQNCYDPTWGRHRNRTKPVPGNHDYKTSGAAGYFTYWGEDLPEPGRGYYSFNLGAWHLIALDSNLSGEAFAQQLEWLKADLGTAEASCVLAYWHHPLLSSTKRAASTIMQPVFDLLYKSGASVVLAGHDHVYERFFPYNPTGERDKERGIRSFTVGTGGASFYEFGEPHPLSAYRQADSWGVLRIVLVNDSYGWEFLTTDGRGLDKGSANCVIRPQN